MFTTQHVEHMSLYVSLSSWIKPHSTANKLQSLQATTSLVIINPMAQIQPIYDMTTYNLVVLLKHLDNSEANLRLGI